MSFANSDNLTSFLVWMPLFLSLTYLLWLELSVVYWTKRWRWHSCLVLSLIQKSFSFFSVGIVLVFAYYKWFLLYCSMFLLYLAQHFCHEGILNFIDCLFCFNWHDLSFFWDRVLLCSLVWAWTHYVVQADIELTATLLSWPLECRGVHTKPGCTSDFCLLFY